jgi:hypothetical protein
VIIGKKEIPTYSQMAAMSEYLRIVGPCDQIGVERRVIRALVGGNITEKEVEPTVGMFCVRTEINTHHSPGPRILK